MGLRGGSWSADTLGLLGVLWFPSRNVGTAPAVCHALGGPDSPTNPHRKFTCVDAPAIYAFHASRRCVPSEAFPIIGSDHVNPVPRWRSMQKQEINTRLGEALDRLTQATAKKTATRALRERATGRAMARELAE